ncbi:hypothetical protein FVB9288_02247 [Flavobacterium sp. CECT 9288]|uniref:tail fiber protein n=1 Tax=Flavobacterium sp. CECT 9288 TaxID=2845819 RepID=UPI001E4119C5|nr:tail fiber protein [Flavobacterium sp. CECT 9288]CAH0336541.1 hypothetical protein FVB9288_02247 [Flavobacterium sp. CECT 9288]
MKTLCKILMYTISFFSVHSFGQTLTSSNATNEGGALQLINPLKTANNIANNWTLYNMTGPYGNSLQFWNYGNGGFYGSRFTILDNGRVGIGTNNPLAQLDVSGDGRFKAADDRSATGALTIETNNGTYLKLGGNTNYSWIQSHNSKPLFINELGNNTIFNLVGGNVGIGTVNPNAKLEISNGAFKVGNVENRNFTIAFPNDVSNQTIDVMFGNTYVNGFIEIEITSGYSYQNSVGVVKKIFSVGGNPDGGIWNTTTSRVVESEGEVSKNFAVGDFLWDATKSSYKISIHHFVKTGNTLFVNIKYSSSYSAPLLETTVITAPYTAPIPTSYSYPQAVYFNGNVGIGTTNPTSKLTVAGNINSREVKVSVDAGADFVFDKDYTLPSLQEVEKFVTKNKHLPEIASAKEMQKEGINLSEMNIKLLQKIEELTLYVIEQNNQLKLQSDKIEKQDQEFKIFKTKIKTLESKKQ